MLFRSEAEIVAQIEWQSISGSHSADVFIIKNSATELARVRVETPSEGTTPLLMQVIAFDDSPGANDFYRVFVNQSTGGNQTVLTAKSWARLARKK